MNCTFQLSTLRLTYSKGKFQRMRAITIAALALSIALLANCGPTLPKPQPLILWEHMPTKDLKYKLGNRPIDEGPLDPFREGDIFFTIGFGKKQDDTKILWIVPISEKPNQSIFITNIRFVSPTAVLEKNLNTLYSLGDYAPPASASHIYARRQIYGHPIRAIEDIDAGSFPSKKGTVSIEVGYKVKDLDKQMIFKLTPEIYNIPNIR